MPKPSSLLLALGLAGAAHAQQPVLFADAALRPGETLDTALVARPSQPFALLGDVGGGPRSVLGQTLYLSLTPALTVLDSGTVPAGGLHTSRFPTPAGVPVGLELYLQAVVGDSSGPRASDGEATVFYGTPAVLVQDFLDPAAQGYTGTFDAAVEGRLQAGAVRRRLTGVAPPEGMPFAQPLYGMLNPFGVRTQAVHRAVDLGASGVAEYLTGIHWRPRGAVVAETFSRVAIDVAHSLVVPSYALGPFSGLPLFPDSGLSRTFAANVKPGETLQRVADGPYAVSPGELRPDGYLPFPLQRAFRYNGVDSLLLDVKTAPSPSAGRNGMAVFITVPSSPRPDARVFDAGSMGSPLDPFLSTMAGSGDNTVHDLQLELTRVDSVAVSPWLPAPKASPDWQTPRVAASVPAGSSYRLEFRGASMPNPPTPPPWSPVIDIADRQPWLQYRVLFAAEPIGGAVPSIDTVVFPVR